MISEDDKGVSTERIINDPMDAENLKDKYYMTRVFFYGLGTITLLPANFFTTATDYWMYKFRDPTLADYSVENRTGLQAQFISSYSVVAHVSIILFAVMTVTFFRELSVTKRIFGSLCGIIILFALTNMFVVIDTKSWQMEFFVTTLITGFLVTAFCAVFMVTLFELASKFPPVYLALVLTGQSVCGILAALIQIFSLSVGVDSITNGLIYFMIGMFLVSVMFIYSVVIVRNSDFFIYHINSKFATEKRKVTKDILLTILNKMKFYMISMFIVMGSSTMIHPGVTSLVVSVNKGNDNKWNDVFFVPVVTFLFYHLFDLVGREFARKVKKPSNSTIIFILSICRIILFPMLMLCNAYPRQHLPVFFGDYAYIIFIIIFAFTNGYLVNLCVIVFPFVITAEERPLATIIVVVIMLTGLGACSLVSPFLVNAL